MFTMQRTFDSKKTYSSGIMFYYRFFSIRYTCKISNICLRKPDLRSALWNSLFFYNYFSRNHLSL